jgi:hypothetical protein
VKQLDRRVASTLLLEIDVGERLRFRTGREVAAFGAGCVKLAERVLRAATCEVLTEAASLMRAT